MNSFLNKLRSKKVPTLKPKTIDKLFADTKKANRMQSQRFDKQFTELTVPKVVRVKKALFLGGGAFGLVSAGLVVAFLPLIVRIIGYYWPTGFGKTIWATIVPYGWN